MHKLCSQTELKFPSYFPSSEVLTHFLPTHTEHRQTAAGHICSIKATPGSDAPVWMCAVSAIPGHFLKLNLAGQSCKPLCSYCKGQSEPPEQLGQPGLIPLSPRRFTNPWNAREVIMGPGEKSRDWRISLLPQIQSSSFKKFLLRYPTFWLRS